MLSDVEEDQPPLNCNVCKTKAKAASAYCIDCAKKLCMEHEKVGEVSWQGLSCK